jgi:hypothetical protein
MSDFRTVRQGALEGRRGIALTIAGECWEIAWYWCPNVEALLVQVSPASA